LIEQSLNDLFRGAGKIVQILEAGCGRKWDLQNLDFKFELTGVDQDAEALRLRRSVSKDLNHSLQGDLRDVAFDDAQFDVIYCSYVLEHIERAEQVLDSFRAWLRPGGVIVLRIPDGSCAYGSITRMTPHWFHVLYYRWILGQTTAGKPGYPPYRTVFDDVVCADGILKYADRCHLMPIVTARTMVEVKRGWRGLLVKLALRLVNFLTLGHRPDEHCTLTFVLQAPNSAGARAA